MADRFPASITIGGRIPRRLLYELAGVIATQGACADWGDRYLEKAEITRDIRKAFEKGDTVRFVNDQAAYGEFHDLEPWLTRHGIDFDRHNDARYEYDAENVYGRGRRRPVVAGSNQDGEDVIGAEEIRRILAGRAQPARKLARVAKCVAAPPALGPIVMADGKQRQSRNKK